VNYGVLGILDSYYGTDKMYIEHIKKSGGVPNPWHKIGCMTFMPDWTAETSIEEIGFGLMGLLGAVQYVFGAY